MQRVYVECFNGYARWVAGTLMFELRQVHTYQRRFDSADLATALTGSNIYIISRRPAIRIATSSVQFHPNEISFDVMARQHSCADLEVHRLQLRAEFLRKANDFRIYHEGAYFSLRVDSVLMHGDSWALAALCSRAREDISRHEVLYVGKAFGDAGSNNSWARTKRHDKLQRIYEEHPEGWDIFVTGIEILNGHWSNMDHIDDDDPSIGSPMHPGWPFWDSRKKIFSGTSIDLVEHSLIAYFNPPYNEMLNEWRVDSPTLPMRKMQKFGLRLLRVHLNGKGALPRFHSRQAIKATRSHLIFHDIPPEPRRPVLRGMAAGSINERRAGLLLVQDSTPLLEDAEVSDVTLYCFGGKAPKVRRPHDVVLPIEEDVSDEVEEAFASFASKTFPFEGPKFDPSTGFIEVGVAVDGSPSRWALVSDGRHAVNGVIMGPSESGKTNLLNVIRVTAFSTGMFLLWEVDIGNRHRIQDFISLVDWVAVELSEARNMLEAGLQIARSRATSGAFSAVGRETPGILIIIEDAHQVFDQDSVLVDIATEIASLGPKSGVALILTVPDSNVARFGGNALRSALKGSNLVSCGQVDGYSLIEDFKRG